MLATNVFICHFVHTLPLCISGLKSCASKGHSENMYHMILKSLLVLRAVVLLCSTTDGSKRHLALPTGYECQSTSKGHVVNFECHSIFIINMNSLTKLTWRIMVEMDAWKGDCYCCSGISQWSAYCQDKDCSGGEIAEWLAMSMWHGLQ